jgi:C4-dicarboxylate transporter DctM subunit
VVIFAVFLFTGVPILVSMGIACTAAILFFSDIPLLFIPQNMFSSTDSFELLAIPFFILAAE